MRQKKGTGTFLGCIVTETIEFKLFYPIQSRIAFAVCLLQDWKSLALAKSIEPSSGARFAVPKTQVARTVRQIHWRNPVDVLINRMFGVNMVTHIIQNNIHSCADVLFYQNMQFIVRTKMMVNFGRTNVSINHD